MFRWLGIVLAVVLAGSGNTTLAEFKPADPAPYVTDTVRVGGNVAQAMTFSIADLRALPAHTVSLAPSAAGSEAPARSYRGVLLRDLIDRAGIGHLEKNVLKKTVIVATASDRYVALFTWAELFNTEVGAAVLVVYAKDGAPLDADEGRIALVSGRDLRSGPRHVKWLKTIELRTLGE